MRIIHIWQNAVTPGVSHISGDATNGMTDIYSHGTIIAGIIAARAVDGSSVEGFAPDATILPIRIFESLHEENGKQTGGPSMEDVSKAVIEAVDHHAQIINISLSDITDLPQMRRAVDYAESHGSLIISSAGNRLTSASTKDGRRFPRSLQPSRRSHRRGVRLMISPTIPSTHPSGHRGPRRIRCLNRPRRRGLPLRHRRSLNKLRDRICKRRGSPHRFTISE